jgi:TorA maturation chaperone TorD
MTFTVAQYVAQCGAQNTDGSGDPFRSPGFGRGIYRDVHTLARLHDREPDAAALRSLFQEGFPDALHLRPEGRQGRAALSALRSRMVELSIDDGGMGQLSRDYLSIYMGPHHLDDAGRMTRRGDDFVACVNVILRLVGDAERRESSSALADYLSVALPSRIEPFLRWGESRGEGSFYGALAAFTLAYCQMLQDLLPQSPGIAKRCDCFTEEVARP